MKKQLFFLFMFLLLTRQLSAQFAFESGNIVVVRVGNGETLSSTGNRVFLEEYDSEGSKVQSIALPYSGDDKLILDGTDKYCGYLNRSANNKYLTLAGFDAEPGDVSDLDESDPTEVNRIVAVIGTDASVDLSTRYSNITHTPRGACSDDGSNLWISASSFSSTKPHVLYGVKGETDNTGIVYTPMTSDKSFYNIKTFSDLGNDMLFISIKFGTGSICFFDGDLPTEETDNESAVTGINTNDFVFLDQSATQNHIDVCYLTNAFGESYGLCKQSQKKAIDELSFFSGDMYVMDTCKYYGITIGSYTDTVAILYATRYSHTAGSYQLVKITDKSGWNGEPTADNYSIEVLASAVSGTAFRGVAMAPLAKSEQYISGLEKIIDKEYLDDSFTLPEQTSAGLDITYTIEDETIATVNGCTFTILAADTTVITATQAGNDDYLSLTQSITLNVDKSLQCVDEWIVDGETRAYQYNDTSVTFGDEDFELLPVLNSDLEYTLVSDNDAVANVSGTTVQIGEVDGTATVYIIQEGNENFYSLKTKYSSGYGMRNNYFSIEVKDATSIDEVDIQREGLNLYPNPVTGNYINLEHEQADDNSRILIYTSHGMQVMQHEVKSKADLTEIDVSALRDGMYYLLYINDSDRVEVEKMIIEPDK